jgi:hypothetical protein
MHIEKNRVSPKKLGFWEMRIPRSIVLAPYDPAWPAALRDEAERLRMWTCGAERPTCTPGRGGVPSAGLLA